MKLNRELFCVCLAFLSFSYANSQTWNHYLSGTTVYDIDVKGNTLIASLNHVSVLYDISTGVSSILAPDTSSSNSLNTQSVAVESSTKQWITQRWYNEGLYKIENGNWTTYDNTNSPLPANAPANLYLNHSTNNLWIDDGSNKFLYDGVNFTNIGSFTGNCYERNGELWIAKFNTGLINYSSGIITVYDTLNTPFDSQKYNQVAIDTNNLVWFDLYEYDTTTFISDHFIGSYDGITWNRFDSINTNLPFELDDIVSMQIDTNNQLVFTTENSLFEFDGVNFTIYNSLLGNFPDISVRSFHIDENGNRWIGTYHHGLIQMSGNQFDTISFSTTPVTGNVCHAILVDNNDVWMGVRHGEFDYENQGLFKNSNGTWSSFGNGGNIPNTAFAIEKDDLGNTYSVGRDGVHKFDGSNWTQLGFIPYEYSFGSGIDLDISSNGDIWVVDNDTLIEIYSTSGYQTLVAPSLPFYNRINCIEIDEQDNVWIGRNGVIHKYSTAGIWTTYNQASNGINLAYIADIKIDMSGNLWAGGNWLYKFNGLEWDTLTPPMPFIGSIGDMEFDATNGLWVTRNGNGIARFDGSDWLVFNDDAPFFNTWVMDISINSTTHTIWGGTREGGVFSYQDSKLVANNSEIILNDLDINVYPNPCSIYTMIEFPNNLEGLKTIDLISIEGKTVLSTSTSDDNLIISTDKITRGLYLLRLTYGNNYINKRIIIE